jgi:hypothetical protein
MDSAKIGSMIIRQTPLRKVTITTDNGFHGVYHFTDGPGFRAEVQAVRGRIAKLMGAYPHVEWEKVS